MRLLIAEVYFVAFVGLIAEPAFSAEPLTGTQLRNLLTGATVTHISPRSGDAVKFQFRPNGIVYGTTSGRKSRRDVGRWSVAGDGLLCYSFQELRSGKNVCHYLVKQGNHLVRLEKKGRKPKQGEDWIVR